jgi:hypothetical protein
MALKKNYSGSKYGGHNSLAMSVDSQQPLGS